MEVGIAKTTYVGDISHIWVCGNTRYVFLPYLSISINSEDGRVREKFPEYGYFISTTFLVPT